MMVHIWIFVITLMFLIYHFFILETICTFGEEMNAAIIYWSRYGNGKTIVEHLSKKLNEQGIETKLYKTDEADPSHLPEADYYIFSSPVEAFNIQSNMRKFIKALQGMDNKKFGSINTHGMKKNWTKKITKLLQKKNMAEIASIDVQVGKDAKSGTDLPEGWENKIDEFAKKFK